MNIDAAQRRARVGVRHRLASSAAASGPVEAARSLIAVHSTDAPSVYLAVLARTAGGTLADIEQALYADRSIVRVMGMRRTVFAVPRELAAVVIAACGREVAARERKFLIAMLESSGLTSDPVSWVARAEEAALAALAEGGELKGAEVAAADPLLETTLVYNLGRAYQGKQKVASRILVMLAAEGRIVRARPVGTWRSSQYRWAPMDAWLGEPLPDLPTEIAQAELARHWLRSFGPAAVQDFAWWAGLTLTAAKRAFKQLDLVEVDLDGTSGVLLAGDLDPVDPPEPYVALLPTLDSTPMGWKEREWYLGGHGPQLFDGTGNVAPTVWCDGRVVGGWAQDPGGAVLVKLLEDVGSDAEAGIARAADELGAHIGPVRLAPRARGLSPLERELMS